MAILKKVTHEGNKYSLGTIERVAAHTATVDSLVKYHKVTGHALVDSADSVVSWTQPANTMLSRIWIVCTTAPTISSGDIGYEVGTSSSGQQIVAASTDTILDGGTTVTVNYGKEILMVAGDMSANVNNTVAARTIYLNLTASTNASVQGEFMWVIETIDTTATFVPSDGTVTAA